MSKFNELVTKLREVFQIDRPELDFGVYRILNARADEINEYLEKRLKEKVEKALATGNAANLGQLQEDLKKAEQGAEALGVSPDAVPKVQEIKEKIAQYSTGANEHENAVFSHLLTFFSRYYDNGDFISQRRYKGDTYAIPYAGEEVMLHWANKDQYYIKSGENFSNYSFKLQDGRVVHFRLIAADTAKDNRKDNDKERRFVLAEHKIITRIDDEGDEYEEEILPVEEISQKDVNSNETKELIIRFEYKAMPKGSKQDKLVEAAVSAVLTDGTVASRWLDLSKREPTEKNPKRTLLEKQLSNYTTKNTADYFIHKNLGKFLRGELDFYIKNEVMHLDDVQNAQAFSDIEKNLRMIQCLRSIALDLIKFLAQLEDFQKKLWTKKKFVSSCDYCLTIDRVPEELLSEVIANEKQWDQWRYLGVWSKKVNGNISDLKAKSYMVDTSLYPLTFKNRLLKSIEMLEKMVDGVLINSDNFQALKLIDCKYKDSVNAIYIDPPYNTDASPIVYKNGFRSSSWTTLANDRLMVAKNLLSNDGLLCATIDDFQYRELSYVIENIFGDDCILGTATIRNNPAGRSTKKGFAISHEYAIFARNSEKTVLGHLPHTEEQVKRYKEEDEVGKFEWVNFRKHGGANANRSKRRTLFYPIYITETSLRIPSLEWDDINKFWNELERPDHNESVVYPVTDEGDEKTWKWEHSAVTNNIGEFSVRPDQSGKPYVYVKSRINEQGTLPRTIWADSKYSASDYGTNLLKSLFPGEQIFSFPKSIHAVEDSLMACGLKVNSNGLVLDFFAGSGTTAHAVINLNDDGGSRKYILVEQGEYFDLVTKPRIQKVVFSKQWKGGKPVNSTSGISHCFKIVKLEGYEDALNNLELKKPKADLFDNNPDLKDDYLLNYMLDVESRGSLLSTDDFKKPFDYSMKIAVDSAGAFEEQKVDLVETFNYLIGLTVKHIDAQPERGFVTVTGTLPSGETCLVLWRDCEKIDYEGLNKLCDKLALNPADNEFDVVYINGDHNIPTVITQTVEEGGETRVLKLRQIEPEFLQRMFAEEDM
jgi:adenine-specific DNA-methyltransferase